MTPKQWFVCPIVREWDDMEIDYLDRRIPLSIDDAGIGFLEVYDSLESFNKKYPDIQPWIVVAKSSEESNE